MIQKLTLIVATIVVAIFALSSETYAQDTIAESSAQISSAKTLEQSETQTELKKLAMQRVLSRYNSVLVDEVNTFVATSYKYDLNPYLLVSISGLESYFAHLMVDGTYNAYGWRGGWHYFTSWEDGIETISKSLRENYYNQGAATVYDVGRKYAESPTWAIRVERFMGEFEAEEAKIQSALSITL